MLKIVIEENLTVSNHDRIVKLHVVINKAKFRNRIGRNWFSDKMIDKRNIFSNQIINATPLRSFKR